MCVGITVSCMVSSMTGSTQMLYLDAIPAINVKSIPPPAKLVVTQVEAV